MSCPVAKAARSKAKDERQSPAPDQVPRSRSKKAKPFEVEWRCTEGMFGWDWARYGRYRTREEAEATKVQVERKYPRFEFRHKGDGDGS